MKLGIYRILAASLLLAAGAVVAEGDAELAKTVEQMFKWDVNGNHWFDDVEMVEAEKHYSPVVLDYFSHVIGRLREFDGIKGVSAATFAAAVQGEESQAEFQPLLEAYDHNHDGRWSRQEALDRRSIQAYAYAPGNADGFIHRFFGIQGSFSTIPDAICQVADRNANGSLGHAEERVAEALRIRQFDLDGDGRLLFPEEWIRCSEEAYFQDALFRLCPEVNQDNDCWLSAAEMKVALAKVTPVYDIDRNGSLDWVERALVIRDGQCAWPRDTLISVLSRDLGMVDSSSVGSLLRDEKGIAKTMTAAIAKYGKAGSAQFGLPEIFAWRRQVENAQMLAMQDTLLNWLCLRLETQMNPTWGGAVRDALWKRRLAHYDSNHDGQLDSFECCRFLQGDFLPGSTDCYGYTAARPTEKSPWYAVAFDWAGYRDDPSVSDQNEKEARQETLPLLFMKIDADGDGLFTPADAQTLKPRLEERQRDRLADKAIKDLLRANLGGPDVEIYVRDYEFEIKAAKAKWRQLFDLDRDGAISPAELRSLQAEIEKRLRDRLPALWLDKLGGFADADRDGQLNVHEKTVAIAMMRFRYDADRSGAFEKEEILQMLADLVESRFQETLRLERLAADRLLLPRYDLNGDGKLSPTERARAEADRQRQRDSGLSTPPQEE